MFQSRGLKKFLKLKNDFLKEKNVLFFKNVAEIKIRRGESKCANLKKEMQSGESEHYFAIRIREMDNKQATA